MDRGEALQRARALAAEHRLGPPDFRQAATFGGDDEVQTYVELEAGGKDAFARLIRDGRYAPYSWRVRHFREHDPNETWIRFTPAGVPYGFVERLPEMAPGPRLTPADARGLAERGAAAWHVALSEYALVEQALEEKPGHRVDHTLVYERPDRIGEGRYRVRLVVAGDRLVEVTPFVRVPEAFGRRYQQMRSANEAIGFGSGIVTLLVYGLGGIVFGLFVLLRQRWVLWRPALTWGVVVAGLQVLATLNEWPLAWLQYDTALSTTTFLVQQATSVTAAAVAMTVTFTLSFMAAESLSRRAFPRHPQLWRVWSPEAGASRAVLGRTAGAYLLVAIFFAYEVALYLVASRWLGWWTPSDALVHPDVLATYMPWLSAIAPSVQAGFWEECLFRAVPLAGAALIGDRFGRRRTCIAIAMIVQAIVFGAGHAPYPNQPAYARPVELILPSLVFGAVYLRFGLLPGIVLHVVFDTVWFALPLFVSRTPGIVIDRTLVVVLALVPLWIVLWRRWQAGTWTELVPGLLNGGWRPARAPRPRPPRRRCARRQAAAPVGPPADRGRRRRAGRVGRVVARQAHEVPPLARLTRDAIAAARVAVRARGVVLDSSWRILPTVDADPGRSPRVREEHGWSGGVSGVARHVPSRPALARSHRTVRGRSRRARGRVGRGGRFGRPCGARASHAARGRGRRGADRGRGPQAGAGDRAGALRPRTGAAARGVGGAIEAAGAHRLARDVRGSIPSRTAAGGAARRRRHRRRRGQRHVAVRVRARAVGARPPRSAHDCGRRERRCDRVARRAVARVRDDDAHRVEPRTRARRPPRAPVPAAGRGARARPRERLAGAAGRLFDRAAAPAAGRPARSRAACGRHAHACRRRARCRGRAVVRIGVFLRGRSRASGWVSAASASGVLALATLVRAGGEPLWPSFAGAQTMVPVAAVPLAAIFSFGVRTIVLALVFSVADHVSHALVDAPGRTAGLLVATGLLVGVGAPGRICCAGLRPECASACSCSPPTCWCSAGIWPRCQ